MIKNIVFDLGGVLVDFNPYHLLNKLNIQKDKIEKYSNIIFSGNEWRKYNSSQLTLKEAQEELQKNYPENKETIEYIFNNFSFSDILFEIKSTSDYLKELKTQGYNIYVLSDLSKDSLPYNQQFTFYKYVTGGVYSFEINSTKPNKLNYTTLLNKYNLIPEETIFIDDRLQNIEAAKKLKIHGIQYINIDQLKEDLKKELN